MYPNDPYNNYTFDPPNYGQLTKIGERKVSEFGRFLRDKYCEFLDIDQVPDTIEARSTDLNRTKASLNLLLQALYPGNIIKTTYQPLQSDTLLFPLFCKLFSEKYSQVKNMAEVKRIEEDFNDLKIQLSLWTGKEIKSLQDVNLIWVTLETEKSMGLELPEWSKNIYPNILTAVIAYYKIMNYNVELRRLNGGMLVRKVTDDMNAVRNSTMDKNRKLMLYSAHDFNVVAVLSALNVYYPHAPKFSSAVIMELHLIHNIYYVKILYYLGERDKLEVLQIPGCNELCPFDQYKNLINTVIPSDFEWNCGKI
ncbi:venom acid phosphatase Acph-1-like isoform X2 [Leptopilina heterotoma]|nr:venom acid phosphatase Acph-1-like isoform X2 [Leptopilina heterotoma]